MIIFMAYKNTYAYNYTKSNLIVTLTVILMVIVIRLVLHHY